MYFQQPVPSIPVSLQKEEFKIIDRYQYNPKYCLGQGSFGKVYIAIDLSTNEQVALKQMDIRNYSNDEYLKNQLISEVQIMKKLHHPNIVKFLDYFKSEKSYYFITEYCQNGDLREYLLSKKLTENEALAIFYQLIEGYKEIFRLGVIHRDLKPANILIDKGVFKISDFGFAKLVDKFNNEMLQTMVGSPLYMSLQILTGKPYTSKCDIWSLGIILFEMMVGDAPWKGINEKDLVNNIMKNKNVINEKKFSQNVEHLLNNMLAYEEKNRISWEELFILVEKLKNNQNNIVEIKNQNNHLKKKEKKTLIFSPKQEKNKVVISDNLKAEIHRFIVYTNELRAFINFFHFINIELFTNFSCLFEMISIKNSNYSLEKFLVLLSQFIRHSSKEMIRSSGDLQIKHPEISKNMQPFDSLFKILKKESFYHEKIYEEIMNMYLKNGFLIELKKDKDIGNVIYGDYTDKEKEKFQILMKYHGMAYLKEISYLLYEKKYDRRQILLIDYLIDTLTTFIKFYKNMEINFIELLKEKGECEDCIIYGGNVLLKYQRLLTIY